MSRWGRSIVASCVLLLCAPAGATAAEPGGPTAPGSQPVTRVLVRFASDASPAQRADMRARADVQRDAMLAVRGLELVDPEPGVSVGAAVADLQRMDGVLYAEPDHVLHQTATPDDPLLLRRVGAVRHPRSRGLGRHHRLGAGDRRGGRHRDRRHPSRPRPNLWTNPGESGGGREANGLDDDGNGRIDDVHGWDFVDQDAQPQDGNGHGTHVSGTIAARGDDATGVAGVSWTAGLMALRVLGDNGSGYVSDVLTAYAYAARNGARVVNASLGGDRFSRAEHDAIAAAPSTLFVVAAGNDGASNDATPAYPCDYDLANVVCVAASDRDDALASFSNYGAASVDLAAPGVDIASTWPGARYASLSGTSMATPHVSGAAALLLAHDGGLTVAGLRSALLSSTHPSPALAGRVATGGRLDVAAALVVPSAPPAPPPAASAAPAAGRPGARAELGGVGRRSHRPRRVAAHRSRHPGRRPRPRTAPRARRLGGLPREHRGPHRREHRPPPAPRLAHHRARRSAPQGRGPACDHRSRLRSRGARAALRQAPARRRPRRGGRRVRQPSRHRARGDPAALSAGGRATLPW